MFRSPWTFLGACILVFSGLAAPLRAQPLDAALEAYYAANALYNRKLYDLAEAEYRSFLARYPNHEKAVNARLGLALALYEQRQFAASEPILAQLAEMPEAPNKTQIYNLWGQCLLIANKPAEAEAAFRWSVNRGKERFYLELPGVAQQYQESPQLSVATVSDLEPLERGLAGLIEALFQQGKWREVVEVHGELVELVPQSGYVPRTRFLASLANYEMDAFEEAATLLRQLIDESGDRSSFAEHAYFLLAECQRELGQLNQSARNHNTVARQFKGKFADNALFRLGYIRFLQKRYDEAIEDFNDLRALYPRSAYAPEAGLYLGRSQLEMGRYREAEAIFAALQSDPQISAEATLWLAKSSLRQDNHRQAATILKPALDRYRDDPLLGNIVFDYGNALMGMEDFAAAALAFSRAAREFPESDLTPDAIRLEAFCLHRAGGYQNSLDRADAFLAHYPHDPRAEDVAFLKAENLFFIEDYDQAAAAYRQFIPFEGKGKYTDEARFRLVQALAEQERWPEVTAEAEPLLREQVSGPFYAQLDYLVGLAAFHTQRWSDALKHLERFASNHPTSPNADGALIKAARALESLGRTDAALARLERLLSAYPESVHAAHARAELGRLLYEANRDGDAQQQLQTLLAEHPTSRFTPRGEYYLGWIALRSGDQEAAAARFSQVVDNFPQHELAADALFQRALIEVDLEQFGAASTDLRDFLERYPRDQKREEALFFYGVSLARQSQYEQALGVFRRFQEEFPQSANRPRAHYEMAWCQRALGRPDEAKEHYEELRRSHARHELARRATLELAEVFYDEQGYDQAINLLDALLSQNITPELRERALYRQAWSLLGREQDLAAANTFELLLREYPRTEFTFTAAYQAGEVRLGLKEFAAAHELFRRAVEYGTDGEEAQMAMLRLGETQTLTDRWQEAENTFRLFLKKYPSSQYLRRAHLWAGWSHENQREYETALEHYREALTGGARDEVAARAQFQIGESLFALGQYDAAIKELIKVELTYGFAQWSARAILEIGNILDKKGLAEEANARYREVADKFPNTDEAIVAEDLLRERKVYTVN